MSRVTSHRGRDRDYDDEPERRTYTTVKRYQIAGDDDRRSTVSRRGGDDDEVKEKITIKRTERRDDARSEAGFRSERGADRDRGGRDEVDVRITERTTERTTEREPERRDIRYRVVERDSDRNGSRDFRVVEREREVIRAPSPPEERVREYRFERERDYSPPRTRVMERDYDVERYSKTTDYYGQPQPIIIRESAPQPIIIREERRGPQQIIIQRDEPQFEFIEREEVRNEQALVVKDDPPKPASTVRSVVKSSVNEQPQEEDYYYERRIREYRRNKDEIKPSDSASQYSSDDSYEYVRRERYVEDDSHHKRHLAEGAIAGAAAAGIIRSHRKSQGKEDNHRGRDLLGGAALGAVGAEVISRARSMRASSRRREYDEDDDRDRDHGHRHRREHRRSRSRSRSQSKPRVGKLTGLAAVAAVGALAGYAIKKSGKNKETVVIKDGHRRHRSHSRRRRGSRGSSYSDDQRLIEDSKHRNPDHSNRRIAQAGLASATAAGIIDHFRSKSRGGRDRSKSRVRTALPIVGAGLGGAALAGLYERNQASKEATRDRIVAEESGRGRSRSRSRARSRSAAPRALDGRRDDPMVAYGADPVYRDHYDDGPASYRRRDRSAGSSPDTRHRSRSRGRDLATAGAAAAAGAAIAHHAARSRSRNRSRSQSRDRRHHDYDDRYPDEYAHGDYITPPVGGQNYPSSNYFPPPPTGEHITAGHHDENANFAPYNPADYPPAAATAPRDLYSESTATLGAPNPHDTFAGDNRHDAAYAAAEARERAEDRELKQAARSGDAGNVSEPIISDHDASETTAEGIGTSSMDVQRSSSPVVKEVTFQENIADDASRADRVDRGRSGQATPRARSTSRVRFDLESNVAHSPELRHQMTRDSTSEESRERQIGRRRPSSSLMNDPYERRISRSESEDTEDLPARFDEHGNKKGEASNDLASRLSEIFGSSRSTSRTEHSSQPTSGGAIEDMLKGLVDEFFRGDEDDGRTGRRLKRS